MRPGRRLVALVLTVLVASTVVSAQAEALRVLPLVRDDRLLVSFELTEGLNEQVRAAIQSGLKTTFTYSVELRLDVPLWVDRTIGTVVVTNSVEYDNLTRVHSMERTIDGRLGETIQTRDVAIVQEWMTTLARMPLFSTGVLEPNRDYYVRVSASARPGNGSIIWPFGSGPSAQAGFTFIR